MACRRCITLPRTFLFAPHQFHSLRCRRGHLTVVSFLVRSGALSAFYLCFSCYFCTLNQFRRCGRHARQIGQVNHAKERLVLRFCKCTGHNVACTRCFASARDERRQATLASQRNRRCSSVYGKFSPASTAMLCTMRLQLHRATFSQPVGS